MGELRQLGVSYSPNSRPFMQGAPASSSHVMPTGARVAQAYDPLVEETTPVESTASDLCIESTKAGKPCRGKKVQGTDFCFSHVRFHRDVADTTAD